MIFVGLVLLFVEAKGKRTSDLIIGVEGVDDVLGSDSIVFSVIVKVAYAGDFVSSFLYNRVVKEGVVVL